MKQGAPLSFTVMVFPKYKDFVIAHTPLLYVKEKTISYLCAAKEMLKIYSAEK